MGLASGEAILFHPELLFKQNLKRRMKDEVMTGRRGDRETG